jgi:type II secretory ATPase GspE/PulE/Tfp pilus assembly ATPase PilB-like protein
VAKTGHLVLGTLHADSIEGTITRLTDPKIGLTREELTAARMLRMLTYQALVPVLCKCAMDAQGIQAFVGAQGNFKEQRYLQYIATQFTGLGLDAQRLRYRNPQGCAICRHRGTKGLTIVAEMLLADDDTWLDLCAAGKDRAAWRYYRETYSDGDLLSPNMDGKTVMEHAIFKAMKGEIDPTHIESFGALDRYEPVRKNSSNVVAIAK